MQEEINTTGAGGGGEVRRPCQCLIRETHGRRCIIALA